MASIIKCDTIQSTTANVSILNSAGTEYARFDATGAATLSNTLAVTGATTLSSSLAVTGVSTFAAGTAALPAITTTGDTNTGIFFSAADTIDFAEGGTATGQFDSSGNFKFNSGYGSVATAYGCRAWVNFNGTGTVAIRASGNVSSITDNNTGDYTINFATALSDANYSSVVSGGNKPNGYTVGTSEASAPTSSSFRVLNSYAGVGVQDATYVFAAVFR
jgi:hypothetical protein